MRALLLVWAALAQEKAPESLLPEPLWFQWKDAAPGWSVTHELQTGGRKFRKTVTLKEKTADRMTFQEVVEADGTRRPASQRIVAKPKGNPGVYDVEPVGNCKECKKPLKDHKKSEHAETAEKMKILEEVVACRTYVSMSFDCEGKEASRNIDSYSDDVPGFLVRSEFKDKSREYKIACVAFEKK